MLLIKNILFLIMLISLPFANFVYAQFSLNKAGFFVSTDIGEESVTVTNTGDESLLLYATEAVDETKKISGSSVFYLSPPVSKLSPGMSQKIRVIIKNKDIRKEMLARLLFQEVIPRKNLNNKAVITSAYNVAAVAHPQNLEVNLTPWEYLKIKRRSNHIYLTNNSAYVIRMVPSVSINSKNGRTEDKFISFSYILPDSEILIGEYNFNNIKSIDIKPVSQTAIVLDSYRIVP